MFATERHTSYQEQYPKFSQELLLQEFELPLQHLWLILNYFEKTKFNLKKALYFCHFNMFIIMTEQFTIDFMTVENVKAKVSIGMYTALCKIKEKDTLQLLILLFVV